MMANPTKLEHVPENTIPELRSALMRWRVWGPINALRSISDGVPSDAELQSAIGEDAVQGRAWRSWALKKLKIDPVQAPNNFELQKMLDAILG
jgi:hypothetical protein